MYSKITVQEYQAALQENKLLGLKCAQCGFITAPPRLSCRKCGGQDNTPVTLTGKGKIATFTSVYVPTESRKGKTPFLVVAVEMDEGPWVMGNLIGFDPNNASIDLIDKKVIMKNISSNGDKLPEGHIAPQFVLES